MVEARRYRERVDERSAPDDRIEPGAARKRRCRAREAGTSRRERRERECAHDEKRQLHARRENGENDGRRARPAREGDRP